MCGRASLTKTEKEIKARFDADFYSDQLEKHHAFPNYNICPSQVIPVITNTDPSHLQLYRWGLIPFWAKDVKIGYKMFNARKETILEKPAFKQAAQKRRCLVVMDSFYEWKKEDGRKTPYRIMLKDMPIFAVAGLWEKWIDTITKEEVHSCTVITQAPNEFMGELHDRMPAILTPEQEKLWIDDSISPTEAVQMLAPIEGDIMTAYAFDPNTGKPPEDDNESSQLSLF